MYSGKVLLDLAKALRIGSRQLDHVSFIANSSGSKFEFNQRRQQHVSQRPGHSPRRFWMWDRRRRRLLVCSWPAAFRQYVHINAGLSMAQLGPMPWWLIKYRETRHRCGLQKLREAVHCNRNTNVLSNPADIAMPPHGPAVANDCLITGGDYAV